MDRSEQTAGVGWDTFGIRHNVKRVEPFELRLGELLRCLRACTFCFKLLDPGLELVHVVRRSASSFLCPCWSPVRPDG
jgi:hypothetical protein